MYLYSAHTREHKDRTTAGVKQNYIRQKTVKTLYPNEFRDFAVTDWQKI